MQALWMIAGSLAFSLMGATIKLLASSSFGAFELVFWRGVVGIALMGAFLRWHRIPAASGRFGMHASRSVIGTFAMFCWFYTLGPLSMGTAFTLNYTSPIFIALAVAAMLWWRGDRHPSRRLLYFAMAASFAGVLMILRPSIGQGQEFAFAVGLLGAVLTAIAYLQVRALGALAATASDGWSPVAASDLPALLAIGILAAIGQLCMTRAFGRGRTLLAANLQYSGVVFATLLGWLLFGESHDLLELAGIALIVASGIGASLVPQPPVGTTAAAPAAVGSDKAAGAPADEAAALDAVAPPTPSASESPR